MDIDRLLQTAKNKLQGRFPRYIDLDAVVRLSRSTVADMAMARVSFAMDQAILGAQSKLRTTSEEYVNALYVTDDLQIGIRPEARYLEEGYARREMLPDLLAGKSAKPMNDGGTYAIVPIGDKPDSNLKSAITKKTSELFSAGRRAGASGKSLADMVSGMQSRLRSADNASTSPRNAPTSKEDEFRTASSKQNPAEKWVHPGFEGMNQLEFINHQLRVELEEGATQIVERAANELRR